jgi:hypothetical protein
VLDGRFNVYVAKFDGQQALVLASAVGRRLPAHATGVGKVLLADLDHAALERLLRNVKLERFTKNTLTDKAALYRRLQTIRDAGYGTDDEEYTIGVRCVAVPVRDQRGQVIAAMSVSVPVIRFDEESSARALALLMKGASELSAALGYRETPNGGDQLERSAGRRPAVRPTRPNPDLLFVLNRVDAEHVPQFLTRRVRVSVGERSPEGWATGAGRRGRALLRSAPSRSQARHRRAASRCAVRGAGRRGRAVGRRVPRSR